MSIAIILHGGAGTINPNDHTAYTRGLIAARDAGYQHLQNNSSAVEAVLLAVSLMEDNPLAFNAGTGGSPTRDGTVECDAAVMVGADGSCGAVAGIRHAKNPVRIADKVRTQTPHVLFCGEGADKLVTNPIDNHDLLTDRTKQALELWREKHDGPVGSATVGAVALDASGVIAAATSTGGVLGKWPGRVGDSPLIGSGTYANKQLGISCTGKGEAFIRAVTAKDVALRYAYGASLRDILPGALRDLVTYGGTGGLICLNHHGQLAVGFNTPHMAYAYKTAQHEDARVATEATVLTL